MNTINREYAKTIMFNLCPFSKLHTNETLIKIEKELENIYQQYVKGEVLLYTYVDQQINEIIYDIQLEEDEEYYDYTQAEDAFEYFIDMCMILKGDDQYEYHELNDFYFNYKNTLLECDNFTHKLPEIISGYIFLRNNNILNTTYKCDYNVIGSIENIYLNTEFIVRYQDKYKNFYKNNKKVDITDLLTLKQDEHIICEENNIIFFTKVSNIIIGIEYEKTEPLKAIHYASLNESYTNDIIHLYDYNTINRLKPKYKEYILKFIENQKMLMKEVNMTNDIFNIICEYIYTVNNIDQEIETIEREYKDLLLQLNYVQTDTSLKNVISEYIHKIVDKCNDIDKKELTRYNRKMYRLKLISNIFNLLKTEKGVKYLKMNEKFNQVINHKREQFLEEVNIDTDKWFIDILQP